MDSFKGFAIILVVVGHVIGGLHAGSIIPESKAFDYVYHWIYAFHMPAFFFVAGLFAAQSLRSGLGPFIVNKLRVLAYPYFLWGTITWSVAILGAAYIHSKPDALTPIKMFYSPHSGPWFLYTLFLILMLFGILASLGLGRIAFLVVSVLAYGCNACGFVPMWDALDLLCQFVVYFALGVALRERMLASTPSASPTAMGLLFIICFCLLSVNLWLFADYSKWLRLPNAVLGITALYGLSALSCRLPALVLVDQCGKKSLEIYVLHPFPSVFARILLESMLGVRLIWLHTALGIALGLLVPLGVSWLCDKFGFDYLFAWGGKDRGELTGRARAMSRTGVA